MIVLLRLALHCTMWICLHYCSFSEGEISELHVGILLLAISYILNFLNCVFESLSHPSVPVVSVLLYVSLYLKSLFFSQPCFITT